MKSPMKGSPGEAVSERLSGIDPDAHPGRPPEDDHEEQDDEHQHLTALAHHRDVFGAENIEP